MEDVCIKQGFQPTQYDLKHHKKIMDLTNTIRFSNLPNKATLEMVETERKREEVNVTVGLQLEDGKFLLLIYHLFEIACKIYTISNKLVKNYRLSHYNQRTF